MKTVTKDKILQRAAQLFFAEGFAVGIDRVTLECSVAKMTIYSEFRSKDGLICAILKEVRRSLAERIAQVIEPALPTTTRLRAVFNLVCYGMNDRALKLGLGIRALTEFPASTHPVHQAALALDRAILQHLQPKGGSAAAGSSQAPQQLLLLAKGCFHLAPLLGVKGSREVAIGLAAMNLNQLGKTTRASLVGGGLRLPAAERGTVTIQQP